MSKMIFPSVRSLIVDFRILHCPPGFFIFILRTSFPIVSIRAFVGGPDVAFLWFWCNAAAAAANAVQLQIRETFSISNSISPQFQLTMQSMFVLFQDGRLKPQKIWPPSDDMTEIRKLPKHCKARAEALIRVIIPIIRDLETASINKRRFPEVHLTPD